MTRRRAHPEEEEPAARTSAPRRASARHARPRRTHLHDAPPAMALALIVLAIGSVVAGYVGVPHALGGCEPDRGVPRAGVRGARDGAGDEFRSTEARRGRPSCCGRRARDGCRRSTSDRADADGALERHRHRRHRHRRVLLAAATARPPTRWRERFAADPHAAAEQVLRRRDLRRRRSCSRSSRCRRRCCGRGSTRR